MGSSIYIDFLNVVGPSKPQEERNEKVCRRVGKPISGKRETEL